MVSELCTARGVGLAHNTELRKYYVIIEEMGISICISYAL